MVLISSRSEFLFYSCLGKHSKFVTDLDDLLAIFWLQFFPELSSLDINMYIRVVLPVCTKVLNQPPY
jgi:hypothetical protein